MSADMSLVSVESFNIDNLLFEDVKKYSNGDIAYHRIPIKYRDGELTTYGVQENRQKSMDKKVTTSDKPIDWYSLPLITSDDTTNDVFERILEKCKEHLKLKSTRIALNKFQLAPDVMDVFYRKRDQGKLVAGAPPMMYPKLFTGPKIKGIPPKITTEFYDTNDEKIDPLTLIGVKATVRVAIIVRDINVGAKPNIQLKVNDAIVIEQMSSRKRLLAAPIKTRVFKHAIDNEEEEEHQPVKTVRRRI